MTRALRIAVIGDPPAEPLATALAAEGFLLEVEATSSVAPQAWSSHHDLVLLQSDAPPAGIAQRCQRLRAGGCGLPLLVIGSGPIRGAEAEAVCVLLLEAGADDVLLAPFGLPELVARCRALLRRHGLQGPPLTVLRLDGLELVEEECRVSRDGVPVQLSHREFQLLLFLMRHPGQPWSRSELMERVWGPLSSYELDQKTVDVHIRWLRRKLEPDPANPGLIRTVRGRGYQLGPDGVRIRS